MSKKTEEDQQYVECVEAVRESLRIMKEKARQIQMEIELRKYREAEKEGKNE